MGPNFETLVQHQLLALLLTPRRLAITKWDAPSVQARTIYARRHMPCGGEREQAMLSSSSLFLSLSLSLIATGGD